MSIPLPFRTWRSHYRCCILFLMLPYWAQAQFPNPASLNTAANGPVAIFPIGTFDTNWYAAAGDVNGPTTAFVPSTVVGKCDPTWFTSPFPNAEWINYDFGNVEGPCDHKAQGCIDVYFRREITLPATNTCGLPITENYCLGMDFYADNAVFNIKVNGITNFQYTDPKDPYDYPGFFTVTSVNLCEGWQGGTNTILVHVKSCPSLSGFLAQANNVFVDDDFDGVVNTIDICPGTPGGTFVDSSGCPAVPTASSSGPVCAGIPLQLNADLPGMPSYDWSGPNGFADSVQQPVVLNAVPGTYSVTVTSPSGCSEVASTTVSAFLPVFPMDTTVCNGALATLSAAGGGSYTWSSGDSTAVVQVGPGNYSVVVTNQGCSASGSVTVQNNVVNAVIGGILQTCNNDSSSLTASGGTQFLWNTGDTTAVVEALSGLYSVTVTESACTDTVSVFVNNSSVSIAANAFAATCGEVNGQITVVATGNAAPFQYAINGVDFQPLSTFSSLAAGNYTVQVRDSNGCSASQVLEVDNIEGLNPPELSATPASCGQNNGTITVLATGGSGTLLYSIDSVNFQVSNVFLALTPGPYTVFVVDSIGCNTSQSFTVGSVEALPLPTLTVGPTACGENNGTIVLQAPFGDGAYEYSLDAVLFQVSNVFDGLASGVYTVFIVDSLGCSSAQVATIASSVPLGPIVVASTPASCGLLNGVVNITVSGGSGSYLFSLDGTPLQSSGTFENLAPGTYLALAQDASGCADSLLVTVGQTEKPEILSVFGTPANCGLDDGTLTVTANNAYLYALNGNVYQLSPVFEGLPAGGYLVQVQDSFDCIVDTLVEIDLICDVYIPNVFSPDDDGFNDYFRAFSNIGAGWTVEKLIIFDRWGDMVYSRQAFSLDDADQTWWDGRFRGEDMLPGVYAYFIELQDIKGQNRVFKGDVTLIR
ncbi:MAG: gliding motility-associated C-terminal domain-containing protein [Saprospiraceae bacterium]